jgi:hypothetical protein
LEESAAVVGGAGDEICPVVWSSVWDRHGFGKRTSGAKARGIPLKHYGTAEAVPLTIRCVLNGLRQSGRPFMTTKSA